MERLSFRQLPLIVKIAVGLVFNNAWWSLEEFVINRTSVWKYMPYYRTNAGCVWDLGVALIVGFGLWHLSRRRGSQPA